MRKILAVAVLSGLLCCGCAKQSAQETELPPTPVQTASAAPVSTPEAVPTPVPTPEPSRIVYTTYETEDFAAGDPRVKELAVYLPEGFDTNRRYSALFLMHVSGCDETFWPGLGIQELMDGLISSGAIEPVLVFMPDGYIRDEVRGNRNDDSVYIQFSRELQEDLLPFAREEYPLYGDRDHLAFAGASFGSFVTVNCALRDNLDAFSRFGCIGGGTIDQSRLEETWAANGTDELAVKMLYIAEGEYDDRGPAELSAINLRAYCSKFDETNLVFSLIEGVGHDPDEWKTGVMQALVLFQLPG